MDPNSDGLVIEQSESVLGAKQMQLKIILELFEIDEPCAKAVIETWRSGM